ncbi:hypothetical protein EVAR_62040_1 [Eumeta japonica]|uniref:Uncharacterized protein n=1 Tax=Eumeta variegata TaxID=151549 RepID=A0A4C1YTT3_EUMVA|nr:hypothetical protein EVAR_62040_1 [Eumeta japonica]
MLHLNMATHVQLETVTNYRFKLRLHYCTVSPFTSEQRKKYKIENTFTPAGRSCALRSGLAKARKLANTVMEDEELEVDLFMDCANIDILCITEHWLKNFQLLLGFAHHRVDSSFSKEGSIT